MRDGDWLLAAEYCRQCGYRPGHERAALEVASGGELAPLDHNRLTPLTDSGTNGFAGGTMSRAFAPAMMRGDCGLPATDGYRKWKNKQWVSDLGTNPCATTVTAMIETRSGMVAMGSVESGLYLLRPQAESLHFSQTNGCPHDWIRCLCEDREGTLWAGAGNGGTGGLAPRQSADV